MLNDFLFLIGGVGLANLIVYSDALSFFRKFLSSRSAILSELLSCMMCTGFWSGVIFSLFFGINIFIGGCAISLLSSMYDILKDYILVLTQKNIEQTEGDDNGKVD